ncbi:HEAT repeat domain-containing protein [Desulfomicrobium baculatum]|uniref:MotA/TolQ/ExbB proton channel n=1 Tax=Desulfomicrobium baculatum (strain DSM 4028 / VKM B-1378 / X) TaxID=525897 RepID=C7LRW4_DESBD|nr:HEAT repeat domain-containing protein [Desulfomicrobium baculatum]ACU89347.1 MotA/TolQ/ExbB proton channel [Desulfomicrobium baculatum DSM 4028]
MFVEKKLVSKVAIGIILLGFIVVTFMILGRSIPELFRYYNDLFGPVFIVLVLLTVALAGSIFTAITSRDDLDARSALAALLKELNSEVAERRIKALQVLVSTGHKQSASILSKHLLEDKAALVRVVSARGLGEVGGRKALDSLNQALDDAELDVRLEAAKSVFQIKQVAPKSLSLIQDVSPSVGLLGTVIGLMMGFAGMNLAETELEVAIQNITRTMAMACSTTVYGIILGLGAMLAIAVLTRRGNSAQ